MSGAGPKLTARARRLGISTSPQKLNLVARLIRGLSVSEARRQLVGCRKSATEQVAQTLEAAVVNADKLNADRLVVSESFVGKGKYLKRIRPWRGKGRFGIEHKKYAHLTVVVREVDEEEWESSYMQQYVHLRYGKPGVDRAALDDKHPVRGKGSWSMDSQLCLSFKETLRRVDGLKGIAGASAKGARIGGARLQTDGK